jgi:hypothetical protein
MSICRTALWPMYRYVYNTVTHTHTHTHTQFLLSESFRWQMKEHQLYSLIILSFPLSINPTYLNLELTRFLLGQFVIPKYH